MAAGGYGLRALLYPGWKGRPYRIHCLKSRVFGSSRGIFGYSHFAYLLSTDASPCAVSSSYHVRILNTCLPALLPSGTSYSLLLQRWLRTDVIMQVYDILSLIGVKLYELLALRRCNLLLNTVLTVNDYLL